MRTLLHPAGVWEIHDALLLRRDCDRIWDSGRGASLLRIYELVCSVVSLAYMASIATLIMPLRARLLDGLSDNLQQFWVKTLLILGALLLCGVCDLSSPGWPNSRF